VHESSRKWRHRTPRPGPRLGVMTLALAALCALTFANISPASAAGDSIGVTPHSIKISVLGQFSGTAGPTINSWYTSALGLWANEVNAAGGIHGRKIQLVKLDTMDTPEGAVLACHEVQSNGSFAAMVVEGVNGNIPAIECLDRAGIPDVYNYPDPRLSGNLKQAFSVAAGFDDLKGVIYADFVKNYLHEASEKIGVVYTSDDPVYVDVGKDFISAAKAEHLKVVDVETVTSTQSSAVSELEHMKNAGVQLVFFAGDTSLFSLTSGAKSINYLPKWFGPSSWADDDFSTAGLAAPLAGSITVSDLPGTNSSAYAAYAAKATAAGVKPIRDSLYFYSYALVMGKALQAAGTNLTRSSFVNAIEGIKDFNPEVGAPVSYSKTNHDGADALFPVECCSATGTWKSLGPAQTFAK
jgi:branched-chain amino acid transport system substrate-binding protein